MPKFEMIAGASARETIRNGRPTKLHPLEFSLVLMTGIHLGLMPWALGTMWWWLQVPSLVLSAAGLIVAMMPRSSCPPAESAASPSWALRRFAPWWLGLALLGLIVVQCLNPSWRFVANSRVWWLSRVHEISWLPTGISGPFSRFNGWRQLIIVADAFLLMASLWKGISTRRSILILLAISTGNGVVLGFYLTWQSALRKFHIPWAPANYADWNFTSTFVYKNHAGAYFGLAIFGALALAASTYERARRSFRRSSPAGVWLCAAVFLFGAVAFTLSRGALILASLLVPAYGIWYFLFHRKKLPGAKGDMRVAALLWGLAGLGLVTTAKFADIPTVYARIVDLAENGRGQPTVASRVLAREASLDLLRAHGLRGIGAGGFRYLFPEYAKQYPPIYEQGTLYWEHAHCDWLEFPIELGLPGDLIVGALFAWWAYFFIKRSEGCGAGVIALGLGCIQTLIHAGFDFPFACPAILALWVAWLTLAAKWSHLTLQGRSVRPGPAF